MRFAALLPLFLASPCSALAQLPTQGAEAGAKAAEEKVIEWDDASQLDGTPAFWLMNAMGTARVPQAPQHSSPFKEMNAIGVRCDKVLYRIKRPVERVTCVFRTARDDRSTTGAAAEEIFRALVKESGVLTARAVAAKDIHCRQGLWNGALASCRFTLARLPQQGL